MRFTCVVSSEEDVMTSSDALTQFRTGPLYFFDQVGE